MHGLESLFLDVTLPALLFLFFFFCSRLLSPFFFLFPLFSCVLCVDRNVAWIVWNMNQTRGV